LGYQQLLLQSNRDDAKWSIVIGVALILMYYILITAMGWSTAPRQNGRFYLGFTIGIGAILYGAYCWITAAPEGFREDLD